MSKFWPLLYLSTPWREEKEHLPWVLMSSQYCYVTCTSPASHKHTLVMNVLDCFLICKTRIISSIKLQVFFSSEELMRACELNGLVSCKKPYKCQMFLFPRKPSSSKECWVLSPMWDGYVNHLYLLKPRSKFKPHLSFSGVEQSLRQSSEIGHFLLWAFTCSPQV